jgi:hypothetical protein
LTGFGYDQKEEIADVHLLVMFLFHINNGKVTVSGVVTAVDVDVAVTFRAHTVAGVRATRHITTLLAVLNEVGTDF